MGHNYSKEKKKNNIFHISVSEIRLWQKGLWDLQSEKLEGKADNYIVAKKQVRNFGL